MLLLSDDQLVSPLAPSQQIKMAPTDARFARLQTDPRFRRPKQKALKVEIDERFKDVLNEDFGKEKGKGECRGLL